jgi:hypothetical protein
MPLQRMLGNGAFEPEAIDCLMAGFERACRELGLADRANDPLRDIVAGKIIDAAKTGERDPLRLCERALSAIRDT